jgi:hypothetical protein
MVAETAMMETATVIGGPQVGFCQYFSEQNKTKAPSSTSLGTFYSRKLSPIQLPPLHNCNAPFPHPHTEYLSLFKGINRLADKGAYRLPWGMPYHQPIFDFHPPSGALACKPIKIINHGIFPPPLLIILPCNKSWGKTPSARQILMPTPFRGRLHIGIWARASWATVTFTLGSSSAGIAVGWGTTM